MAFIHKEDFDTTEEAQEYADTIMKQLGKEYYDVFVAEVE